METLRTRLPARPRVAVIGAGISGITAAYLLQRRYDVTLFESDGRLGGHAHTHDLPAPGGRYVQVDSGFIVHNERTYPNLLRLFAELGTETQDSDMSMSVRCVGCGLEYAGARGLRGLLAQPSALMRPSYLRMLTEVRAFHRAARRLLAEPPPVEPTLGEFLDAGGFSRYFADHFLLPLVSAVWSSGSGAARVYPARYLFRFLDHHGMLSVTGAPVWKTVIGGSRSYVESAVKHLAAVETERPVRSVRRVSDGVEVRDQDDSVRSFDHAVIATHADQALRLLDEPSAAERRLLGAFGYSRNETLLHTDDTPLPASRGARASWNYLLPSCSGRDRVTITYDMNRLQRLDGATRYFVTLNAAERVDPQAVLARMVYEHPVYTLASVAAQARLPELNTGRIVYAGAYHGWGFHEDGCASGARAALALGVPW